MTPTTHAYLRSLHFDDRSELCYYSFQRGVEYATEWQPVDDMAIGARPYVCRDDSDMFVALFQDGQWYSAGRRVFPTHYLPEIDL